MSIFLIKIIAVITMFCDHIKYAIPQTNNIVLIILGRIAFPLFCFALVEGYVHTSNKEKYIKRLLIFAIISQIPFMLFRSMIRPNEWKMLNVMVTMLFGFVRNYIYR